MIVVSRLLIKVLRKERKLFFFHSPMSISSGTNYILIGFQ